MFGWREIFNLTPVSWLLVSMIVSKRWKDAQGLVSRLTGQVRSSTHMDGYRVNQDLNTLSPCWMTIRHATMKETTGAKMNDTLH